MTTPASETALQLAQTSLKAQEAFGTFIEPHLKEWLKVEFINERFDENEVKVDFTLTEYDEEEEALTFWSAEEDIYVGFGEYETIRSNATFLPLEFLDNPEKFFIEAREAKAIREKEALQRQMDKKKELVRRLEGQLAQVRATQAELDKLKTTN
jgi:hypothetical protein